MEKDDFLQDEFLRDLIRKTPLEEPSDDFVSKVMAGIEPGIETVPAKKPFFYYLKVSWPYAVISLAMVVFLMTSDLPFAKYIPGNDFLAQNFLPSFQNMFSGFSHFIANSKFTTIGLIVVAGAGLLFLLDKVLQKGRAVAHHTLH